MARLNDLVYSIEKTGNWQLFLRLGKHLYFRYIKRFYIGF